MIFNKGDIVYYVSGKYGATRSNPLKGSKYECQGAVSYISPGGLGVKWDNNTTNSYINSDIELAIDLDKDDPNLKWANKKKRK